MIKPSKIKVKVDDTKMKKIFAELKKLENAFTLIGIQEGAPTVEGVLVSDYTFWNEYGTKTIPERPFMRGWFDGNLQRIKKFAETLYGKVADGTMKANTALKVLGQWAQDQIRKSIINLKSPPNAPSTIRIKKSSNPLIDTGTMLNSIHHTEHFNKKMPKVGVVE